MNDTADTVAIKLLDREYQVKCPLDKVADLQEAANYLNIKMRESMENGKFIQHDKILMIAALNIANELIALKRQKNYYIDTMSQRIVSLQNKIEEALSE